MKKMLGIEFGSTRIKAVLADEKGKVLASGSYGWENRLLSGGVWTYRLEDALKGMQAAYAELKAAYRKATSKTLDALDAIGVSGMMHGYLPFDARGRQLAPFRTWRCTITAEASEKLTKAFDFTIPQRWSVAHLYQRVLDGGAELKDLAFLTTLAGWIHFKLTGEKVLGLGEASGMFPVDPLTKGYDAKMARTFDRLAAKKGKFPWKVLDVLPQPLPAGEDAGALTEAGARLLDPSGDLAPGALAAPPEGDVQTGMAATNTVRPGTANISAGTSAFAVVTLAKPLAKRHPEIDVCVSPTGTQVAMSHANTCTSDINAWVTLLGGDYDKLFKAALDGAPDCGGIVSVPFFGGEPVVGVDAGCPLVTRAPDADFTLANFMRAHIYSAFAAVRIGLGILFDEGLKLKGITGHGGIFKTPGVAQQILADAVNAPATCLETAGEGGAWGMALLAAYAYARRSAKGRQTLEDFLAKRVFAGAKGVTLKPTRSGAKGFAGYLARFKKTLRAFGKVALTVAALCAVAAPASSWADIVLFDAASADASKIVAQDGASFSLADGLLTVKTKPSERYPGVCIPGTWDLSRYGRIEVEFVNGGINGKYTLRLLNPGGDPGKQKGSKVFKLPIKYQKHAVLGADMVSRNPQLDAIAERLKPLRVWALPYAAGVPYEMYKGRHSAPQSGIGQLDPKDVVQVAVYINQPKLPHTWSVKRIVAKEGASPAIAGAAQEWTKLSEKDFFPFLDKYGQFRHKEWPDKVHSDADFARQREKEEKDLAAHPGPKGWDKWGGWADGPQLPKTGGFSTTKWNGKWWIVDPDGHLWWSHGPVRVLPSSAMTPLATPAGDRSGWFAELPKRDDPVFGMFYETRDELLWPYYGKRGIDKVYDFSAANIRRKYGEKWFETWADLAHRRLRSWSCNTIANSSDKRICLMDRTPYTERFEIHARPIAGHKGGWWEFCDPFDPSFRAEARRMTEVYRAEIDDPWCFGFFVDNEHHWGVAHTFGLSTLKSPADQPCKSVFRERLKAKYGDIAKLNAAWGMSYKDWEDFLRVKKEPKSFKGAKADLEAFSSEIAETYFRIIREELKRANPGKLYLGCRWAGGAPAFTVKAAAKYCDVLSYNVYRKEMSGFKLPEGIDAPVMIGEFHFGALDRGPFCPGLILLRDQKHRAETYKEYVRTSLEHPQIVGVHWHQFSDQATSGRFDGENMQVGWTDVCDTPYWETIGAVREIGARLYEIRASR